MKKFEFNIKLQEYFDITIHANNYREYNQDGFPNVEISFLNKSLKEKQ